MYELVLTRYGRSKSDQSESSNLTPPFIERIFRHQSMKNNLGIGEFYTLNLNSTTSPRLATYTFGIAGMVVNGLAYPSSSASDSDTAWRSPFAPTVRSDAP